MNKQITKRKAKICKVCDFDGSGTKFKTCSNRRNGKRCNGEWEETIDPYCYIQIIVDEMPQRNKDIALGALNDSIKMIENKIFPRNLEACKWMYGKPCPYQKYCWKGDKTGLKEE